MTYQERLWDEIPDINQKYWKHRDTLTIIELAFILKGKEPQPQATQGNVLNLYPIDFCEFFVELLSQADSSWKINKLIEINPSAPYCEAWADPLEFEREELIKWAISKEYEVPEWLQPKYSKDIVCKNNEIDEHLDGGIDEDVDDKNSAIDRFNTKQTDKEKNISRIINVISPHLQKKYNSKCITDIKSHVLNNDEPDLIEQELKTHFNNSKRKSNCWVENALKKGGFTVGKKGVKAKPLIPNRQ